MATSTSTTAKREAVKIRTELSNPVRYFSYTKLARDTHVRVQEFLPQDAKLTEFARGEIAMTSDCFLLYAIAVLGVADLQSIRLFLSALSNKNKDLSIMDMSDSASVRRRLRKLASNGMLFKHAYEVEKKATGEESPDGADSNHVTLYTITNSTQDLMNKRLGRRVVVNDWIQGLPLYEMMGWAACSFVSGMIARNKGYIEQVQGIYTTKAIGTVIFPNIIKMKSTMEPGLAYVGLMYAFLHLDRTSKTEEWFNEDCHYMVKRMKQFLYSQDAKHRLVRLVVVVEDNEDLVQMATRMVKDGQIEESDFDRIFFTGEGVIRQAKTTSFTKCFLRVKSDSSDDNGFVYEPVKPDFIL